MAAVLAVAALAVLVPASAAPAQTPLIPVADPCAPGPSTSTLDSETNLTGLISLHFFFAQGTPVDYYECIGRRAKYLGHETDPGPITVMHIAGYWRCDRLTRHFVAFVRQGDGSVARGSTAVRTTSCAHRFGLRAPRRVRVGRVLQVALLDEWSLGGLTVGLCVIPPHSRAFCRPVRFRPAVNFVLRQLRPHRRGVWRFVLHVDHRTIVRRVAVGVRAPEPQQVRTVLATGDSTMLGTYAFLADDVRRDSAVVGDVVPGIGISEADAWQPHAVTQMAKFKPDATVISIGVNEGFPMHDTNGVEHGCCGIEWETEYARRLRLTMTTYLRGGRAQVFWMTLPTQADPARAPINTAVNQAILDAAQGLAGVHVLRMDQLFTPNGYSPFIVWQGRRVRVRTADGVHLNVSGTSIEARVVAAAMRPYGF